MNCSTRNKKCFLRCQAVNSVFLFRQQFPSVCRQTQFIAISIIDKIAEQANFPNQKVTDPTSGKVVACAALLLAMKFNDSHPIKVLFIVSMMGLDRSVTDEVIEVEQQLVLALDFQIPICTAYLGLFKFLQTDSCAQNRNNNLAALKLLIMSVKKFQSVILDEEFGREIGEFVYGGKTTQRVRKVYNQIRSKDNKSQYSSEPLNSLKKQQRVSVSLVQC